MTFGQVNDSGGFIIAYFNVFPFCVIILA